VVLPYRRDVSRALEVVPHAVLVFAGVALFAMAGFPAHAVPEEARDTAAPEVGAPHRGAPEVPGLEVPLVQLDVLVADSRGEPVLDLGRDDFVLLQDDLPVPLAGFSAPPAGGPAQRRGAPAGDGSPLHLVLYFHLQFLEPGDLAGLPERVGDLLRRELPPDARVMLAMANPDLRILQGFTTDRERLVALLDEVVRLEGSSRLDAEYNAVLREIRQQALKPIQEGRAEIREAMPRALLTRIGSIAEQAYRELEISAAALARLMTPLAGLPGRREVLVVSGRLPAQAGPSLFDAWYRAFNRDSSYWGDGRVTGGVAGGIEFDSLPEGSTFFDNRRVLTGLAEIAAARNVVLHTLDVSAGQGRRSTARGSLGDRQALALLAEKTGGRDLAGSAVEDGLGILARDLDSRYVLAFAPPQGPDGETHEITVRVPERRRLKVRHSPVYRALSRDQRTAERVMSALALAPPRGSPSPATQAGPARDNPLEAEAEPVEPASESEGGDPAEGATHVAIRVPLANLALIPEGRIHRGQISIFSSSAEKGGVAPVAKAVVPVQLANEDLLTVQGRRIEYLLELPAGSGTHRLAVAVRDDFQDLTSLLVLDLGAASPGEPDADGPRVALPVLPKWVAAGSRTAERSAGSRPGTGR